MLPSRLAEKMLPSLLYPGYMLLVYVQDASFDIKCFGSLITHNSFIGLTSCFSEMEGLTAIVQSLNPEKKISKHSYTLRKLPNSEDFIQACVSSLA